MLGLCWASTEPGNNKLDYLLTEVNADRAETGCIQIQRAELRRGVVDEADFEMGGAGFGSAGG